jgi:hypothetical protein
VRINFATNFVLGPLKKSRELDKRRGYVNKSFKPRRLKSSKIIGRKIRPKKLLLKKLKIFNFNAVRDGETNF